MMVYQTLPKSGGTFESAGILQEKAAGPCTPKYRPAIKDRSGKPKINGMPKRLRCKTAKKEVSEMLQMSPQVLKNSLPILFCIDIGEKRL